RLLRSAARIHKNRPQRRRRADEQAVALRAAEADVGDDLVDQDLAKQRAVRGEAVYAVTGRGPDVALGVETKAVEQAGVAEHEVLAAADRCAVGGDRILAD